MTRLRESATSCSMTCEPTCPAPPVTRMIRCFMARNVTTKPYDTEAAAAGIARWWLVHSGLVCAPNDPHAIPAAGAHLARRVPGSTNRQSLRSRRALRPLGVVARAFRPDCDGTDLGSGRVVDLGRLDAAAGRARRDVVRAPG